MMKFAKPIKLVLLLPLTEATRQIIDHRRLKLLKPGIKIINPGRGALIDESALIEELQSGHVGGATLDTVEDEPLDAELEPAGGWLLAGHG